MNTEAIVAAIKRGEKISRRQLDALSKASLKPVGWEAVGCSEVEAWRARGLDMPPSYRPRHPALLAAAVKSGEKITDSEFVALQGASLKCAGWEALGCTSEEAHAALPLRNRVIERLGYWAMQAVICWLAIEFSGYWIIRITEGERHPWPVVTSVAGLVEYATGKPPPDPGPTPSVEVPNWAK